jgi:hypothetical protein
MARSRRDHRSPKLGACFQKGIPRDLGELLISSSPWEVPAPPRETEGAGRDAEQSYEPILPTKVGNRRAPARGGHGTHWREGANKRTHLLKET